MSSRALQKAQLRVEREAAERREIERIERRRQVRLWAIAAVLAAAVGVLAAIGTAGKGPPARTELIGTAEGAAMLAGIPQEGTVLGDPRARVVLTEFADLQCPYCKDYALSVLPQIIETYVRPGKLRLDLQLLRFIGPDSERGAHAALNAAEQGRMWHFVDLWYRNQGQEGTGYADDGFIEGLAKASGVTDPLAGDRDTEIAGSERAAATAGIDSTPAFLLDGRRLQLESLTFEAFAPRLDAAIG